MAADYKNWVAAELITASGLNKNATGGAVDSTELIAIDTTLFTGFKRIAVYEKGMYYFDPSSTLPPDDDIVYQPTTGGGRWIQAATGLDSVADFTDIYNTALGTQYQGLSATISVDVSSISANSLLDTLVSLAGTGAAGAAAGDELTVTPASIFPSGVGLVGWAITASNQVTLRHYNFTGSPIDPVAINYIFVVRKHQT